MYSWEHILVYMIHKLLSQVHHGFTCKLLLVQHQIITTCSYISSSKLQQSSQFGAKASHMFTGTLQDLIAIEERKFFELMVASVAASNSWLETSFKCTVNNIKWKVKQRNCRLNSFRRLLIPHHFQPIFGHQWITNGIIDLSLAIVIQIFWHLQDLYI
jgi:hypothetical protein